MPNELTKMLLLIELGEYIYSSNNQHFDNHVKIAIEHKDTYITRNNTRKDEREANPRELAVHEHLDRLFGTVTWSASTKVISELMNISVQQVGKYKNTYPNKSVYGK
jgi:hypothetical protein